MLLSQILAIPTDDNHNVSLLSREELAALNAQLTDITKLFNSIVSNIKDLMLNSWFQWDRPMRLILTSTGIDTLIDPRIPTPTEAKNQEYKSLLDKHIIALIHSHINVKVLRCADKKGPFLSTLHFWTTSPSASPANQ